MLQGYVILIAAHVLGDFVLQTNRMAAGKHRHGWLMVHVGVVLATTLLLAGAWPGSIPVVLAIGVTHWLIDRVKTRLPFDGWIAMLVDQGIHFGTIACIQMVLHFDASESCWVQLWPSYPSLLCLLTGGVLASRAGHFLIIKASASLPGKSGPPRSRTWDLLGQIERVLIMVCIVARTPWAIGLVLAARMLLLRPRPGARKAEKSVSFHCAVAAMSVMWGIVMGILTRVALSALHNPTLS